MKRLLGRELFDLLQHRQRGGGSRLTFRFIVMQPNGFCSIPIILSCKHTAHCSYNCISYLISQIDTLRGSVESIPKTEIYSLSCFLAGRGTPRSCLFINIHRMQWHSSPLLVKEKKRWRQDEMTRRRETTRWQNEKTRRKKCYTCFLSAKTSKTNNVK